ncbi:MAG: hypothetical protein IPK25_15790 [Saprospiraceae bacterium]|nr:hypothetical protein [Saprospiraceae bacterium]
MYWLESLILKDNRQWDEQKKTTIEISYLNVYESNKISYIPIELSKIDKLNYFDVGGNYDKLPIKSLGGLINHPSIQNLDLSYCEFTSLLEFETLENLKFLNISNNLLTSIELNLSKLHNLISLNVESNNIQLFSNNNLLLKLLEQLDYINLKNNPINLEWLNPAILEASGDKKEELIGLLSLSIKGFLKGVSTLPQKVILLGNSEVGKTELAKVLIKDKSQFPDKGTTHGLKIRKWELGKKFNNKSVFIYDFGGQDFYHSVYNMFFTYDTVYIIVWDDKWLENQTYESQNSNDTFIKYNPEYWIKNIQYFWIRIKLKTRINKLKSFPFITILRTI